MEGKKYIQTVKVVKEIPGFLSVGGPYKLQDLKRQFPFLDFTSEYFEMEYFDKFEIYDKVRFTGKNNEYHYRRGSSYNIPISKEQVYYVRGVSHEIKDDTVITKYRIEARDAYAEFIVPEEHLELAESKWIVSFSGVRNTDRPAVHELDYFSWMKKIKGTWKEIFVFDTQKKAEVVADMFAKHSMEQIMRCVNLGDQLPGDVRITDGNELKPINKK